MGQPVIFVGSSSAQLPLVTNLVLALEDKAEVKEWTRAFAPGVTTLNGLMSQANEVDFAAFIFGPDDWTESRSVKSASPRDNVVFEAGLFGAVLGWDRSIIVHAKGVKLPSDLEGLTLIKYDGKGDPERQAQLIGAKLAAVIGKVGRRGSGSLAGQMEGYWWQFSLSSAVKIERGALSLLKLRRSGQNLSLQGQAWTAEGVPISRFWSKSASLDEDQRTLFYWWEGDWPGHPDAPQFFGKGEIALKDPNMATGYFTIRSDDDRDPRERKSVDYLRATDEEVKAVNEKGASKRREVILRMLKKREDMLFLGGKSDAGARRGSATKSRGRPAGQQELPR